MSDYPAQTSELELMYPIEYQGATLTHLTFRRPRVKDQLIAEKQNKLDSDKEVHLISMLSGVDPEVIQLLDFSDYQEAQKIIVKFNDRPAKSTSSEDA
jgi:uncharacterized protein (DUF58 family)